MSIQTQKYMTKIPTDVWQGVEGWKKGVCV